MVVDLYLVEVVLIEEEVVAEEMNGAVVQQVEICLAEEVIPLLEAVDLNILQQAMILGPNIIQGDRKDIQAEVVVVNIQTVIRDLAIPILEETTIDHLVTLHVKG